MASARGVGYIWEWLQLDNGADCDCLLESIVFLGADGVAAEGTGVGVD